MIKLQHCNDVICIIRARDHLTLQQSLRQKSMHDYCIKYTHARRMHLITFALIKHTTFFFFLARAFVDIVFEIRNTWVLKQVDDLFFYFLSFLCITNKWKKQHLRPTWSPAHGSFLAAAAAHFTEDAEEMALAKGARVFAGARAPLGRRNPVAVWLARLALLADQGARDRGHCLSLLFSLSLSHSSLSVCFSVTHLFSLLYPFHRVGTGCCCSRDTGAKTKSLLPSVLTRCHFFFLQETLNFFF